MKLNEPRQAGIRAAQNLTEGEAHVKTYFKLFHTTNGGHFTSFGFSADEDNNNNNNVHLSCAHQCPERSHDTY